jgi:hypothetical protein
MRQYLVNSRGSEHDFSGLNRATFGIAFYAELETISPVNTIIKNRCDSLNPSLSYRLSFLNPTLPIITIHSFSFTRLNGEEIPSMLYYKNDTGVVVLDKFPYVFKNKEDLLVTISGLQVVAECSESYHQTKDVYINFDVQIDTVRIDTSILYSRKLFADWRPKF